MLPVCVLPAIRWFQCRNAAVGARRIKRLADRSRSTDASKCGQAIVQITWGTGGDSGERSEQTQWAESRLGVPRKQNGGERRARLGIHAVKRSRAREKKGRKEE